MKPAVPVARALQRELFNMPITQAVAYYLGVPVAFALLLGWHGLGLPMESRRFAGIVIWIGLALIVWWAAVIGTLIMYRVLKPWRPSSWFVCLLGSGAGAVLFLVPVGWYLEFAASALGAAVPIEPSVQTQSFNFLGFLIDVGPGTVLWIVVNVFYERVLGIPRFSYGRISAAAAVTANADTESPPAFIERLRQENRGKLLALQAEDHYVRVFTDKGSELLHYRLVDAIRDANMQGARTHRSYWVAEHAAIELDHQAHRHELRLTNGMSIPVSRTYLEGVRAMLERPHG